jgi:hypothetical protein
MIFFVAACTGAMKPVEFKFIKTRDFLLPAHWCRFFYALMIMNHNTNPVNRLCMLIKCLFIMERAGDNLVAEEKENQAGISNF